jgi:hypothetical protein
MRTPQEALRDAGITADPGTGVPVAGPVLTLRTVGLAAASRGSR